ncbi:hypothetical protein B0H13DRAFT_2304239 [Mycena leptocephala]|nr:hypothetical protein B0H13DRAFT_2304239 [Mycena leptocephala]
MVTSNLYRVPRFCLREPRLGRRCYRGSAERRHDAVAAESRPCDDSESSRPSLARTAGNTQQRAPRPSYALQARRSGAPRAHPTARIACLTGILSRLMPGVVVGVEPHPRVAFVGVEPHPWIAIVNVEPHPWVAFVGVEPCPHVAFVVPGAHPHVAFVVPGAHPHVAFVELRLRPRLLCVGTTRALREHGTLALSSGEPAFLLPLLPPRSTSSLTPRCRDFAKK